MASSDDESGRVFVKEYYFEDQNNAPISFHVLPIQWSKDKRQNGERQVISLRGKSESDNGQPIHRQVVAWRVDILSVRPVISVLTERNKWIVLRRPRLCYVKIIKSILVTLHFLSYVIWNPKTSSGLMWRYLTDVFSVYEGARRPSPNDLEEHMPLIREAVKWEKALAKSELIVNFLEEGPTKGKLSDEDIQFRKKRRLSTVELSTLELFDTVCAICDNGGNLFCCEGRCLRSFHETVKDGEDFNCESLALTQVQVEAIGKFDFYCKNCQYNQHQCFSCGKLGSSDRFSGPEVLPCAFSRCGKFYHPHCILKLSDHESGISAEKLEKRIMLGESFTCPIHKCHQCKQGEDRKNPELQFAVCRRCPKSYHRKCLPRAFYFEKSKEGDGEERIIRAWEGLLHDRVLIYCKNHKLVKSLGTPRRNHVKFPDINDKKTADEKNILYQEKIRLTSESPVVRENSVSRRKTLSAEGFRNSPTTVGQKMTSAAKVGSHSKLKSAIVNPSLRRSSSPLARNLRFDALMEQVATSVRVDDVTRKRRVPSTHVSSKRTDAEMNIALKMKVVQTEVMELHEGCGTKDEEAVSPPEADDHGTEDKKSVSSPETDDHNNN